MTWVVRVHIDRVLLTFWRAAVEFVADRGHRAAAQVAFFALLSVVPLALLLVAVLGLAFEDDEVRRRVVEAVFDNVSLAAESDRARLERALTDSLDGAGSLNVVSIVLLLVAATGVTSGLRYAVNQAWDFEESPPLLRRKLLDLVMVLVAASTSRTSARCTGRWAR